MIDTKTPSPMSTTPFERPEPHEAPACTDVVILRVVDAEDHRTVIGLERRLEYVANVDGSPLLAHGQVGFVSGLTRFPSQAG
jgi:hypothetical protein